MQKTRYVRILTIIQENGSFTNNTLSTSSMIVSLRRIQIICAQSSTNRISTVHTEIGQLNIVLIPFESTCCSTLTQALRNLGDFSAACGGCGNVNSSGLLQHLLWMLPAEHLRLSDSDRIGVLLQSPFFFECQMRGWDGYVR